MNEYSSKVVSVVLIITFCSVELSFFCDYNNVQR